MSGSRCACRSPAVCCHWPDNSSNLFFRIGAALDVSGGRCRLCTDCRVERVFCHCKAPWEVVQDGGGFSTPEEQELSGA